MTARRRPPKWTSGLLATGLLAVAGCHGGPRSGQLASGAATPYSAARPTYGPPPVNPLFISGYAGRNTGAPSARIVVPESPPRDEPGLLP
jgi:hypothetical protein